MDTIRELVKDYLAICKYQRRLNSKTIKAYQIDLRQFCDYLESKQMPISKKTLSSFIMEINQVYQPLTVKRKIASLKAFFNHLERDDLLPDNPFHKLSMSMREPIRLPRTIPLRTIEGMLHTAYQRLRSDSPRQKQLAIKDIAVMEMLFATGIRVSELCHLDINDVDLIDGNIYINGKGAKERLIQIGNTEVLAILKQYSDQSSHSENCPAFFTNQRGSRLSEQSVRLILRRYEADTHVTPHMCCHFHGTSA